MSTLLLFVVVFFLILLVVRVGELNGKVETVERSLVDHLEE
jgi:hypothetical protein